MTLPQRFGRAALDVIYPPQSLLSGAPSTGLNIESELWRAVTFLDEPCCKSCGYPFEFDIGNVDEEPLDNEALGSETLGGESYCAACTARPPAFDSARAAFAYDEMSRKLVLDFKHGGRMMGLPVFASHMARAGRMMLAKADYIVPVPLHPKRLRSRRYNQAAILARALSKNSPAQFDPDILQRVKNTAPQGGQTHASRADNVRAAFALREGSQERLRGAHIVLVDDVYTSGATLQACAKVLRRGGASHIDGLCLARVVKPTNMLK